MLKSPFDIAVVFAIFALCSARIPDIGHWRPAPPANGCLPGQVGQRSSIVRSLRLVDNEFRPVLARAVAQPCAHWARRFDDHLLPVPTHQATGARPGISEQERVVGLLIIVV